MGWLSAPREDNPVLREEEEEIFTDTVLPSRVSKIRQRFFYRAAESQSLVLVFVVMFLLLAAVVGGGTDLHLSFAPVFAQDSGSTEANKMSPLSKSNSQEQQK